ncbi:MAG: ppkA, partial [Candidatus Solibacter sp.]|nr:ppkA [Candidatus Solibacter sp.]
MEPDLWSRSEQVFHDALKLKAPERTAFVRQSCAADSELYREVLSLLESHVEAAQWLVSPALPLPPETEATPLEGQRVGAYRIDRQLGEGGMGAVFLASRADDQYQKNVAIKLVRTGLQTPYLEERFRNERQILAALEHPHIARLLDGGITSNGQPFLVMEYVEGVAVDEWCDARGASIAERLHLFRKLCAAVHYAHQHLVIHRDLKPSNILVTAQGEPKLLDFGIAKLIDTGAARVDTTEFLMATPLYASPELVNGQPVSTATDVYSLGVILYRLLTGNSPYGTAKSGVELLNAILGGDIVRPRGVPGDGITGDGIPGDLESIVLKALRREPELRYASAELLAEDVRRHLESLPVLAGSESFRYSAAKFVRRNRGAVLAGVIVGASLVTATAVSVYQSSVAARERRLAEYRLDRLRQLTGSVLFEFHDAIQTLPGATQARKLLVQRALEYLNGLDAATA